MTTVPQENQSSGMSTMPLIIFGILALVFGFMMWWLMPNMGILPPAASTEAQNTDALFRVLLGIGGVVFFLVQGLIYYAAYAFRAKNDDTSDGPHIHGNVMLEIVWTITPSLVVFFLAVYSYNVWIQNTAPLESPNAIATLNSDGENIVINAIGQRYAWSFEYITNDFADAIAEDGTMINGEGERVILRTGDLYIYAGQSVELDMNTRDVIHSFWAPEMRVKQDLLPGRTTTISFHPQLPETSAGWSHIMLNTPVMVYTAPNLESDLLHEMPLAEGALPEPVEFQLADPTVSITPEADTVWLEVLDERGESGYVPITADTPIGRFNRYRLICTELCGGGHGDMYTDIVMFENRDQLETVWYEPNIAMLSVPAGDLFELGESVIGNYGCAGCHTLDSFGWVGNQGPALNGIGARTTQRAEPSGDAIGNEVDPGAEYLVQALWRSQDYLVPGYGAIMTYFEGDPSSANYMPQDELMGIVAYLCTETVTGDPHDSDCGLQNWEFDDDGHFTGDLDALYDELLAISDPYK